MENNYGVRSSDISVLIMSYDGFSDTWEACDKSFSKYWKNDIPVYLVTNHLTPQFNSLITFQIGDKCYSEGINQFLTECKSDYVLLLMADFLPRKEIGSEDIQELVRIMQLEDIDYCSVYFQRDKYKYYKQFKDYSDLLVIDHSLQYAINVMPAIWKSAHLKKLTELGSCDPWQFEVSLQREPVYKQILAEALNVYSIKPIYPLCHTIVKGKYTRDGVRFLKKNSISVDYKKRKKMRASESFKIWIVDHTPRKLKSSCKKFLKKLGFKFYTE